MKILVALNHPAHYYVFKFTVKELIALGYDVKYVIKEKDILEHLLKSEGVEYIKINEKKNRKRNAFSIIYNGIFELGKQNINLGKVVYQWKPNLMIGTDISITYIGKLFSIPSFVFNEDDFEINKMFCKAAYPFATRIIAPNICSVGKFDYKKIGYNGIQKMAYLHPNNFTPDYDVIKEYVDADKPYFLIRLVSLTAGHDIEGLHTGLNEHLIDEIIKLLEPYGNIIISGEDKINDKYKKYNLNLPPNKMHHLIAFADLFIGDSQTMCAEAGLLGTPFLRFNDFVGKIAYLNEIENEYKLGFGIKTNKPNELIDQIKELIKESDKKKKYKEKKEKLFLDKINVSSFYTNLIDDFLKLKE
ncbi:hypothetical protein B0A58_01715 [Flavobacterium branchiophilum NBRC 15030 = ATCC 35035]|uniref:DUF354 domain-containing protein n=1 Tax=Flavobacterium branchiophilum TaxID=55197 RepID=A0A543G635_9FLAO|nr:DUF354 domain-containing protein [Flavobacterium branchiophilum]OXA81124.1 hypothetical protein B0A58_01715 [Flavobacterium branchiophilum NBRC 15030 = ATCC 35035]TQM41550.1 hypothetical protein BC670_2530 [Flavobacterium branchiophilum]GEM55132.1 hypothetical protein FB1_13530 [Flavobacterium branchiophilum NBRC 15030 = ATCC 35035]